DTPLVPPAPPPPPPPDHLRGESVPPDHPRRGGGGDQHGKQPPVSRLQHQPVADRRFGIPVGMDPSAGFPCRARRLRGVRGAGVVSGGHLFRGRETVPVDLPVGQVAVRRRNRDGTVPGHRPLRRGHPRGRFPTRQPRTPEDRGRDAFHPLPLLPVREIDRPGDSDGPVGVPAAGFPGPPRPRHPEARAVRKSPACGPVGRVSPGREGAPAGGPRRRPPAWASGWSRNGRRKSCPPWS
ncbi:MAG: hypothetical protein H6Q84_3617, partial [Deltaproteobacteria bacterium]|nr:hypothetical protein [Deltaproteobacteria bacterium]